jgi:hypothetical protein
MDKQLWTIQEVVMLTGCSESAIRNRIKRGQLPARKIGYAVMLEKAAVAQLLRDR